MAILALLVVVTACQPAPPSREQPPAEAPPSTLKAIMQGLEADMAAVAHGIWVEDAGVVRVAAQRVADHPRVTAEQMAVIQAALGGEFAAFVGYDQAVHGASVALVEATENATVLDLLGGLHRIQQGCVSCHSAFRNRLTPALNPPAA